MKIACLQMNMAFSAPAENYVHAEQLVQAAMRQGADVLVLPETWNTGFFPQQNLPDFCDRDGEAVKAMFARLAKTHHVNIVAGSVSDLRGGRVYNTAYVFDRSGACIASYDKTHLFSPMGEPEAYTAGDRLCTFTLDGVACGILICYDIRFPELARSLALEGAQMLFVVSQWPKVRSAHLAALTQARAIENQCCLALCNSCGTAGATVYGGGSRILDPLGEVLAQAGRGEEIIFADCDLSAVDKIRAAIPVFRDRKPELYHLDERRNET